MFITAHFLLIRIWLLIWRRSCFRYARGEKRISSFGSVGKICRQTEFGDRKVIAGGENADLAAKEQQEQQLGRIFTHYFPQNLSQNMSTEAKRYFVHEEQLDRRLYRLRLRNIVIQVAEKWTALRSRLPSDCARIYLNVCRRWPFFGAKLFPCRVSPGKNNERQCY